MAQKDIYRSPAGAQLVLQRYRTQLASLPGTCRQAHLSTPQGETFVISAGQAEAPPLVLLHGSGANSLAWGPRFGELAKQFQVHAVDIIGEPGLSAPERPPMASDAYARWLDSVLDQLGLPQTTLVGSSLGSWLALDYATRRPDRVTALALTCPPGLGRLRKSYLLKAFLLRLTGRQGLRRSVRMILGPVVSTMDLDAVVEHTELMARNYRYRSGDLPAFTDEALARLSMPVHVIYGEHDVMMDAAGAKRRLAEAVPHATVRVLPGLGHLVPPQGTELEFLRTQGRQNV